MRILYVTYFDSKQVSRYYSGIGHYMFRSLESAGNSVELLSPLHYRFKLWFKTAERFSRWLKLPQYSSMREPLVTRGFAKQVTQAWRKGKYDIVFGGGPELCELSGDIPTAIWSDGTFASVVRLYPQFHRQWPRSRSQGNRAEGLILEKCRAAIFSSRWAAESAVADYAIAQEKAFVVPYGANFDLKLEPAEFEALLEHRRSRRNVLLFVGLDWERKGGALAVAAVRELRRRIPDAKLVIVGARPELTPEEAEFCSCLGILRKSDPGELARLTQAFREASAFILPTRADCAPVAFAEAASFGLPSFGTDVGGVGTLVREGRSGRLLHLEARAEAWADAMASVLKQPAVYEELSRGAFSLWENELNWASAGRQVTAILDRALRP